MSYWTHITGTITVQPMGRTQSEKRYILETVLSHLPLVTGSEQDMNVHIVQKTGYNCSAWQDEFGKQTNNLIDGEGFHSRERGYLYTQDEYILVVEGDLRDRMLTETYREFVKWLCRLAKRVCVCDVFVNIRSSDNGSRIICDDNCYDNVWLNMFQSPTWVENGNKPNWCEYLMWDDEKSPYNQ